MVEIGTGSGVSALWLLRGMSSDGVLTTIDVEVEYQRAAKDHLRSAGYPPARTRTIAGRALDVLPRLADASYDLVLINSDPTEAGDYLDQAIRVLRSGGTVLISDALWFDRVPDPARRDPHTVAMRELGKRVRDDERLTPLLVPIGGGLLAATTKKLP